MAARVQTLLQTHTHTRGAESTGRAAKTLPKSAPLGADERLPLKDSTAK